MNILITGASGFIGGYIVDNALAKGLNVYAVVRKSSNRQYLQNSRINFVELNFADPLKLIDQLITLKEEIGTIDYVIHNAGVTKVLSYDDYNKVNFEFTKNFAEALKASNVGLRKFVFISSLAASGPGSQETNTPIQSSDEPKPVTEYGRSKLKAEQFLNSLENFPYISLRPPAVFGPRDTDMFSVFQLINNKLELYIGGAKQYLSFISVKDLADAIICATQSEVSQKTYFISDNKYYDNVQFSKLIKRGMAKRTIVIKLPIFLVQVIAFFAEKFGKMTGKPSPLNVDKVNELKSSNWLCDANPFYNDTGFKAKYSLDGAIEETIKWYKNENWL